MNMLVKTTQKFIRTSPRKLRLVARALKGLRPADALMKLKFLEKFAAEPMAKVLKTAISDAKNNFKLDEKDLQLNTILVNPGPTLKRGRPVSRGQYHKVLKHTSHITVILESQDKKTEQKVNTIKEKVVKEKK